MRRENLRRPQVGGSEMVNKITWQRAGGITEPGRYMFTFGWLTGWAVTGSCSTVTRCPSQSCVTST